jgi:hypothetical protein
MSADRGDLSQRVMRVPHPPHSRCHRSPPLSDLHQPAGRSAHDGHGPEKIISGGIPNMRANGHAAAIAASIAGT